MFAASVMAGTVRLGLTAGKYPAHRSAASAKLLQPARRGVTRRSAFRRENFVDRDVRHIENILANPHGILVAITANLPVIVVLRAGQAIQQNGRNSDHARLECVRATLNR
jgi:hypothetical protein